MATLRLTGLNMTTFAKTTIGDTDSAVMDGSLTVGDDVSEDTITFNAEVDSDFIPDDNNTHDLGSSSKRWQHLHVNQASFEDVLAVELSISGVQLQTDSNAYRFNCPYNLEITGLRLDLDQHGTSGDVTVSVKNGATTIATATMGTTTTTVTQTSVSNATRTLGDAITFEIDDTPSTNTNGLRALLFFRRTL